jgi:hypothetical protein
MLFWAHTRMCTCCVCISLSHASVCESGPARLAAPVTPMMYRGTVRGPGDGLKNRGGATQCAKTSVPRQTVSLQCYQLVPLAPHGPPSLWCSCRQVPRGTRALQY